MDLIAKPARASELARGLSQWPSLTLDDWQLRVLELLLDGSLAPLDGFMGRAACAACAERLRLPDGTFWPSPIVLDAAEAAASAIGEGDRVALRDSEGTPLAILHVNERWQPEAAIDGPAPARLAGRVEGLNVRQHADFCDVRRRPQDSVRELTRRGWPAAVAFYTDRFPMRRVFDAAYRAAETAGGGLVVQAALPIPGPVDHRHYARVRASRAAVATYPAGLTLLTLLPGPLPAGARGAALGAVVARNHGCTHVVAGDDLRKLLEAASVSPGDLGIQPIYDSVFDDGMSDSRIERILASGGDLPEGLTFPAVAQELRRLIPPRGVRGLTLFFTGLPGSGKSTIANAVRARLLDRGDRLVTLLDGDLVRRHLSSELGFSRDHRNLNIRRIGFVAAGITRHGGIAICVPIAPYDATRRQVREAVEAAGDFVLVHVDTPLDECMARDPKGLYARARAGLIPEFTGVSDPYEAPSDAEIVIRTADTTVEQAATAVLRYLEREGYLRDLDPR